MTTDQIVGLALALVVMFIGLAGSILPGIPSTPLVLIAAVGHKIYFRETGVAWWIMVLLAAITAFSMLVDYLATVYGAKRLGATWRGATGAVVGALIGIFFPFPGLLIGPFAGAMIFEMAGGRNMQESSRAGLGAILGLLAGALGKLACCIAMIGLFAWNVVYRSMSLPALEKVETLFRQSIG